MPMTSAGDAPQRPSAALVGMASAAAALGAGEFISGLMGIEPSPLLAVGARFVDSFAASLKEIAVEIFGTNDKAALVSGALVVVMTLGAAVGLAARRWAWSSVVAFACFGAFGAWAQAADPQVSATAAVAVAAVSVLAGVVCFRALWRLASNAADQDVAPDTIAAPSGRIASRRKFLATTGAVSAGAVGLAAIGRALASGDVVAAVKAIPLPRPLRRVEVPDDSSFRTAGASPYVTRNSDFYRIDTALRAPRVDAKTWQLEVSGMVDHPFSLSYSDLLGMPSIEEPVTLQCVSNEVGGDLVGNAVWQGVPLTDLLDRAGVQRGAEQLFSTSADGWTCGFPLEVLDGDRTALVAYAMNGERLPIEHGFPARLVVSGLYGYVSATKWLTSIELTTWEGADGYWVPRGWAKSAPIKLASRIDVPRAGADVPAGPTPIAGVAWLPSVGVSAVQVSIDGGRWRDCELGRVASEDTWVQWRYRWDASPGSHTVRVRSIDRDGNPQVEQLADPAPDGATGLHSVDFNVTT